MRHNKRKPAYKKSGDISKYNKVPRLVQFCIKPPTKEEKDSILANSEESPRDELPEEKNVNLRGRKLPDTTKISDQVIKIDIPSVGRG